MAGNIKGITIEIGGETTGLQKALKGVTSESIGLQKELTQVEKLLKFNPGNAELVAQKQQLLTKQIEKTSEKLGVLKEAQAQVDAQFASGKINDEQYRAFNRELVNTESSLTRLKTQLTTTGQAQQDLENKTRQLDTLFKATGTSVDKFSDELGVGLTNAIKNGTASSKQLDTAIEKIGKASLGASADVDKMKQALKSADDGKSLKGIQQDLGKVAKEAQEAGDDVNKFGDSLSNVIGGLAAGGGIAGAVSAALDTSSLNTQIDISFNVSEESKESVKEAIRGVEAYGVDAEEALEGVRRQWALNKDASDASNSAVVNMAGTIATAYAGIDFTELIQEANEIAATLGITNEEALGLVDTLINAGFPPEQIDIMAEYGDQLMQAGFSAKEVQAIMASGVDTKSWNIDNLLDGVKEGRIQMADFGNGLDKSMKEIIGKTDISADKFVGWGKAVAQGGDAGQAAMLEATKALAGVEDATVRNQLGTKMFGTMWEDQGMKIVDTLLQTEGKTVDLAEGIENVKAKGEQLDSDPTVQMRQAFTDLKTALEPITEVIAKVVSSIAEWVSNNPTLAATIAAVASGIGILVGAMVVLAPIFTAISAAAGVLGVSMGAVALPVLGIVAAIAAVIAIGVLLYKNWDEISAKAVEIWGSIKEYFSVLFAALKVVFTAAWDGIKAYITTLWQTIKTIASTVWDGIKAYFSTVLNAYKTIFTTVWDAIKTAITTVWNGIKTTATTIWNGIKTYFTTVLNGYKTLFTTIWNSIKTAVTSVWNGLKSTATSVWNGIKSFFTSTLNGLKSTFTSIWNSIKSVVTGVWNALKSAASSVWNGIKSTITSVTNGIKSTVTSVWNSIKSTTQTVWNSIKTAMTKPVEDAKEKISKVIETIKGFFSKLKLKFPKIEMPKLPKFKLTGKFSLDPPSVPKIGVDWYDKGGIFTGPQVIGVGEKRPEFVGALDDLRAIVSASMREVISGGSTTNNNTNNTPVNVILNYSGGMSEEDVRNMADMIEVELGKRMSNKQAIMGVR